MAFLGQSRFEAIWQTPFAAGLQLRLGWEDLHGADIDWGAVDELKWITERSDQIIEEAENGS